MTKRKLAALLCKREGKKSQVAIGNMMEVLTQLEQYFAEARVTENDSQYLDGAAEHQACLRIEKLALKLLRKTPKRTEP